jgi:hypothetical protein
LQRLEQGNLKVFGTMRKPAFDAPRFKIGDIVVRRTNPEALGQVVAIVFFESEIGYMVKFIDESETLSWFEVRKAKEPKLDQEQNCEG